MEQKKGIKLLKIIAQIMGAIFVVICAITIFFNVTHEYHMVEGSSMYPTLNYSGKDGVFISKIKSYTRGDIIVTKKGIKNANGQDVFVIKRLIAIGGDKITVRKVDERYRIVLIYANTDTEIILEEPYLESYSVNEVLGRKFFNMIEKCSLEIDSDGFLLLGEDEIFYLGDNRPVSEDCSSYGPNKRNNVVGKVDYIAYGGTNIYCQVIKQAFGG